MNKELVALETTDTIGEPGTSIQKRVIEQMKEWDRDRLFEELKSFVLETGEGKLSNLFFDDIATEEEHAAGQLKK